MLFGLVDILQKRRRLLYVAAFISIDIFLLTFCTQTLQTHRPSIATRLRNAEVASTQVPAYEGDAFESMLAKLDRSVNTAESITLRSTIAATDGLTVVQNGIRTGFRTTVHGLHTAALGTIRTIGMVLGALVQTIGKTIVFVGKVIIFPFVAVGHGVGFVFGAVGGATSTHLASVITPNKAINAPVITPDQAQQASLIQKDTLAVTLLKPNGTGGACDNGGGNGGYPMEWCDARMDSIRTVSYSSDRINRQCTSYAFWYFTTIEGHSDFHVTGNANRWARTSNYPTHDIPAVGAIAVQTGGYYGHVAIVQALPGQTYDGKVVPDGYILVSEMNYDWQGHFRYAYSPVSKFSSYIYP